MKKTFIYPALFFAAAAVSFAVEFRSGQSGNWGTGTRWSGDAQPTNTQSAFIRSGTQDVYVTLPGEVAHRLTFGQSGSQSTWHITGGSLKLTGDGGGGNDGQLYISWGGDGDTRGVVNLSGGSLTAKGFGVNVNSAADVAQLNISGSGNFDLNGHFGTGAGFNGAENRVTITGSNATIDISNSATIGAHASLEFTLDAGGASTFVANTFTANAAADLVIDFGAYAYSGSGTDKITIVNANNLNAAFDVANISYRNDGGLDYELIQDTGSGDIYLNVVPEPASWALLGGLFALLHIMMRRRN